MQQSINHSLYKPEPQDDVLDTISKISENFEKLDELADISAISLTATLVDGRNYSVGKRIWNEMLSIGSSLGWVNIRDGVYAPSWQKGTTYNIGDRVMPDINNGHYYECIANGTSGVANPVFPTATNGMVYDTTGGSVWIANYVYNVDDIVFAINSNQVYFYKCIRGGTSDTTEPTWALNSGSTINDGSAIWQSYKSVRWKEAGVSCEFREFGRIL